ncbi:ROK family protein [Microterricola viridarii]|uniref:Glucokinase n=1 Tax=Microterricola viridarii TaxID=412690 RepID=A0A1H1TJ92_9MICO|nr:ROK family protein [Microterricola viridarii]SDS60026.1 glucokinase [Microterricola viridarii]
MSNSPLGTGAALLSARRPFHIGIDLGGTKIAGALLSGAGEVLAEARTPTPAGADLIVAAVIGLAQSLRTTLQADHAAADVDAIGIGSAGVVDIATGAILDATEAIPGWRGTALAERVTAATGLPVRVINDVHAHALGEQRALDIPTAHSTLLVAVGTGIGGSFLVGGVPLLGAHSVGGHIGHVPTPAAAGIRCSCGALGHAEGSGSGTGIAANYLASGGEALDGPAIVERAGAGEQRARDAIERSARTVGELVGGLVNTLDPHNVVLSGGVPGIGPLWWQPFERAARAELLPRTRGVDLLLGRSAAAACRGAASLWDERLWLELLAQVDTPPHRPLS